MRSLLLFARAPRRGSVKTRLEPALGAERTLRLHTAFVLDQARLLREFGREGARIELRLDGPWPDLPPPLHAIPRAEQGPGSLGDRMLRAFRTAAAQGSTLVAIVGADAPTLPRPRLEDLFASLASGFDAALVPATDGGYVAIGVRGSAPPVLFDGVPWGSDGVLAATLEGSSRAGVRLHRTAPWFDVDRPEDLAALAGSCARDPGRAPETAALLRAWGIDAAAPPVV